MNDNVHNKKSLLSLEEFDFLVMHSYTRKILKKWLGLNQLNTLYEQLFHAKTPYVFCHELLELFELTYQINMKQQTNIPQDTPLVVVANHPFGGWEGLIILDWLKQIRPQIKFMANFLLSKIKPLDQIIINVNPFLTNHRQNVLGLRQAYQWLAQHHTLITFPSGEVSRFSLRKAQVVDKNWHPHIARIICNTNATVLPIYVHGRNSVWFQLLSLCHKNLGLLLLARELLNKKGKFFQLRVGDCIAPKYLQQFATEKMQINYLRQCVHDLK